MSGNGEESLGNGQAGYNNLRGSLKPSNTVPEPSSQVMMMSPQSSSASGGHQATAQHGLEQQVQGSQQHSAADSVVPSQLMTPPREHEYPSHGGSPSLKRARPRLASWRSNETQDAPGPPTPGMSDKGQGDEEDRGDWRSDDGDSGGVPINLNGDTDVLMEDYAVLQETAADDIQSRMWDNASPSHMVSPTESAPGASLSDPISSIAPPSHFAAGTLPALEYTAISNTHLPGPIVPPIFHIDSVSAIPSSSSAANTTLQTHQSYLPTVEVDSGQALAIAQPLPPFDSFGMDPFQEDLAAISALNHGGSSQEILTPSGPSATQLANWVEASIPDLLHINPFPQLPDGGDDEHLMVEDYHCDDSFSKFLNRWTVMRHLHPATYGDLFLEPTPLRSIAKPGRAKTTVNNLRGEYCDVQGMDWKQLGTTRATARKARGRLYQNRTNVPGAQQSASAQVIPSTERYFAFRESNSAYRISLPHFQLRNLLSVTSKSDVYYVGVSKIMHTDPSTSAIRCVLDLSNRSDFRGPFSGYGSNITCLTASDRVIVAGGFEGEYAIADPSSQVSSEYTIGHVTHADNGITNHVQTYLGRTNGVVQAAFSSNDNHVRILDCYTDRIVAEYEYGNPINASAISPNGRMRVLVQDETDVLITDAERGGVLRTLQWHNDYAFACAWADDGIHVATGAQDMQTIIYDARWWDRPLKIIASDLACPRSLHFSPVGSGRRVLVAAEQADMVIIIDAVTFEKKQTLDFFGGIAGCSFTPGGSEFFVANCDRLMGGILQFERIGYGERYGGDSFHASDVRRNDNYDWDRDDELEWDMRIHGTGKEREMRGLRFGDLVV